MLCQELTEIISETLDEDLGDFTSFSKLFAAITSISKRKNFTLVFDEFQNINGINPSFFSDMQNIWDSRKDNTIWFRGRGLICKAKTQGMSVISLTIIS